MQLIRPGGRLEIDRAGSLIGLPHRVWHLDTVPFFPQAFWDDTQGRVFFVPIIRPLPDDFESGGRGLSAKKEQSMLRWDMPPISIMTSD